MTGKKNRNTIHYFILGSAILLILILLFIPGISRNKYSQETKPDTIPTKALHPVVNKYLEFLDSYLDSTRNVGAALTIVYKGETQVTRTYGVREAGTHDSINVHTVFRLASVSKGFAGVLACMLENKGILSLDDKVKKYLPGFELKDSVNTHDLTLKHILSHTSGLVPHAYDNLIEDGVPMSQIIRQLETVDISAPPGVLYGYQNVIFSLLDTITQLKTGSTYEDLLLKYIFVPLKMKQASASDKIFHRKRGNYAHPHGRMDSSYIPLPVNTRYYNIAPAAGVNASIEDMNKWLLALLGNNLQVMDSSILEKIKTPVIVSPLKRRYTRYWDVIDSKYYSLGWRIYQYKGYKIVYHGGYVQGYRTEIAFCPEEQVGLVFLQNSPNRIASMCVPVFFDLWSSYADLSTEDTLIYPPIPEINFLDDSFYYLDEIPQLSPEVFSIP